MKLLEVDERIHDKLRAIDLVYINNRGSNETISARTLALSTELQALATLRLSIVQDQASIRLSHQHRK